MVSNGDDRTHMTLSQCARSDVFYVSLFVLFFFLFYFYFWKGEDCFFYFCALRCRFLLFICLVDSGALRIVVQTPGLCVWFAFLLCFRSCFFGSINGVILLHVV